MQKNYFIRGKACADYCDKLDFLNANPVKELRLHEDAFYNWKINRYPESETKRIYNGNELEYECG